jgi:hypothetical protein
MVNVTRTIPEARRSQKKKKEAVQVVLLIGLVALFFSLIFKNRWPKPSEIRPECLQEPVQTQEDIPESFVDEAKGYRYEVQPLFNYELWGMVVSSHYAGSITDFAHEAWKDYLNIKDICTIFGRNLETDAFRSVTFRSRDFTCYYSYTDPDVGELFSASHISNNHLITSDRVLIRAIKRARRGDQVRIKGWLVNYRHEGARYGRSTSTVRTDTGDHACEVVYVTEFEILKRANPEWRAAFPLSILLIAGSVLALFFI